MDTNFEGVLGFKVGGIVALEGFYRGVSSLLISSLFVSHMVVITSLLKKVLGCVILRLLKKVEVDE